MASEDIVNPKFHAFSFSFLGVNSNYTITIDRDEVWQRRMREVYIFISKSCDIVTRSSSLINSYSERQIHNCMVYSRGEVTCLLLLIPDPGKLDACFHCSVSAGVHGPDGFLPEVYRPPHYRPHYLPHWSISDRCSSRYQPIPLGDRHAVSNRTVIMCNCNK